MNEKFFTFKDKVMLFIMAVLLATLLLVSLTAQVVQLDEKKQSCQRFCKLNDSEVKVFEKGVCICHD